MTQAIDPNDLQQYADLFPRTRDGKLILPGCQVWYVDSARSGSPVNWMRVQRVMTNGRWSTADGMPYFLDKNDPEVYSTKELATREKARRLRAEADKVEAELSEGGDE